ncbi:hypothetical protein [Streptomyces sp. NPDC058989]|uniref:hypothetical protein n=1 Tax=Streptomyces sp. NPDC058989 TaxID=3346686 RepID=UPI0036736649
MALLNWRSAEHYDYTGDQPCVLCNKPTPLRSDKDKPVHKVCAENWLDTHTKDTENGRRR